jgi:asparagine synthase (glutamine-hydrolysing)
MTQPLAHRGFDAEGFFDSGEIYLGHRRLSVVDLAGSAQPLFNENRSVFVAFNWEMGNLQSYNFHSLREPATVFYDECNSAEYIDRIMYVDTRLWLPDDVLTKVDRATMAHSLEARVPYLDHRLVETCARLRPDLKRRGDTRKFVLKKIAEKYLPHEIVHRRKQGFVMPLRQWLGQELKTQTAECLSSDGLSRRNLLQPAAISRLQQHHSGAKNHSGRLWTLLVLESWFRHYEPDFVL